MAAITAEYMTVSISSTPDRRLRPPPVVLLAGFKAPATSWRYQVGALTQAGFQVFSVDLRGHGSAEHSRMPE